jgi:hypothetical protein
MPKAESQRSRCAQAVCIFSQDLSPSAAPRADKSAGRLIDFLTELA